MEGTDAADAHLIARHGGQHPLLFIRSSVSLLVRAGRVPARLLVRR